MKRVEQEDEWGCGIAVLAMLTGQTYAAVDRCFPRRLGQEAERDKCVQPHEMYGHLWDQGYSVRVIRTRRYAVGGYGGKWPSLVPFAPMHYAMVDSPTQLTGHWIAIDGDGTVLDPFDASRSSLDCYEKMHEIVGVFALAGRGVREDATEERLARVIAQAGHVNEGLGRYAYEANPERWLAKARAVLDAFPLAAATPDERKD